MLFLLIGCATIDTTLHKPGEEPCDSLVWYADVDGDGVGGVEAEAACEAPTGYVAESGDCDDGAVDIFPGADEVCNDLDDDCDGEVDEDPVDPDTWYTDQDGDGFGDPEGAVAGCVQPSGTVAEDTDCLDSDDSVFPGADEFCNDVDDDCDGDVDEDPVDPSTWYMDSDGDGWGVATPTTEACELPSGYADNADDCDDGDPALTDHCGSPISTSVTCSNAAVSQVIDPNATEPELHVLSLYEADLGHGAGPGTVTVNVQRATEMTLVLSSYEPVNWNILSVPGAQINAVLANGYHDQAVSGVAAGIVEVRSFGQTGTNFGYWCGYELPYTGGGCDTDALIAGVEGYVGQTVSSFTGCYHGTSFQLQ